MRFTLSEVEHAQRVVYAVMPPTPQFPWPAAGSAWLSRMDHNVAEGAGAAGLAAAIKMRARWPEKSVGVPLTGGNVDSDLFARILGGHSH